MADEHQVELRVEFIQEPGSDELTEIMIELAKRPLVDTVVRLRNDGFSRLMPEESTRMGRGASSSYAVESLLAADRAHYARAQQEKDAREQFERAKEHARALGLDPAAILSRHGT